MIPDMLNASLKQIGRTQSTWTITAETRRLLQAAPGNWQRFYETAWTESQPAPRESARARSTIWRPATSSDCNGVDQWLGEQSPVPRSAELEGDLADCLTLGAHDAKKRDKKGKRIVSLQGTRKSPRQGETPVWPAS